MQELRSCSSGKGTSSNLARLGTFVASVDVTNGTSLSVNPGANLLAIAIGHVLSYHRLWSPSLS